MRVDISIGGAAHARIEWTAIPPIGADMFVSNVFQLPGNFGMQPKENFRDGILKVVSVVWYTDRVMIDLEKPDPVKFNWPPKPVTQES